MKKVNFKSNKSVILSIFGLLILTFGATYAFFTYSKDGKSLVLSSGNIDMVFNEGSNTIVFNNMYPISDAYALANLSEVPYIDFNVQGNVDGSKYFRYEIYLKENSGNTLSNSFVKIYLTDENNTQIVSPTLYSNLGNTTYSNDALVGKLVYGERILGSFSKDYRLYAWLDSSYSQNNVSQTFSFNVNLYGYND